MSRKIPAWRSPWWKSQRMRATLRGGERRTYRSLLSQRIRSSLSASRAGSGGEKGRRAFRTPRRISAGMSTSFAAEISDPPFRSNSYRWISSSRSAPGTGAYEWENSAEEISRASRSWTAS